jgi:hypothetical protein
MNGVNVIGVKDGGDGTAEAANNGKQNPSKLRANQRLIVRLDAANKPYF